MMTNSSEKGSYLAKFTQRVRDWNLCVWLSSTTYTCLGRLGMGGGKGRNEGRTGEAGNEVGNLGLLLFG